VFDWNGIVKDLAQHLISAPSKERVGYIICDAERDAARLGCPSDFWDRILSEYEALVARRPLAVSYSLLAAKWAPVVRTMIRRKMGLPDR
jgi:hypothetical protein